MYKDVEACPEPGSPEARRLFKVHLAVYIAINAMLAIINIVTTPGKIWFVYPLAGWGIGLLMHYLFGVRGVGLAASKRGQAREAD